MSAPGLTGARFGVTITADQGVHWRGLGACRGLDASVFFPETDEDADVAKAVCSGCDVRRACLEFALLAREKQGVWGGCTERERRRLVRLGRSAP